MTARFEQNISLQIRCNYKGENYAVFYKKKNIYYFFMM